MNSLTRKRKRTAEYYEETEFGAAQRRAHFLDTHFPSEVHFMVGSGADTQIISAEMRTLCMGSPVFAAMFQFPSQNVNGIIQVPDIIPRIFSKMLQFLSTDDFHLRDADEGLGLYYAAVKYEILTLQNRCNAYFETAPLYAETVCRLLESAEFLRIRPLWSRCLQFISSYAINVIEGTSFRDAKLETVQTILKMGEFSSSKVRVFAALLAWGSAECRRNNLEENSRNIKSIVRYLVPYIDFSTMSNGEFTKTVEIADGIFDYREMLGFCMKTAF